MTAMSRLAVAGALGLCLAPISASAFTFTDTFGPPSSQWSDSSGSWTASSGQYYATVPNNNPESWSYLPYVFTNVSDQVTVSVNNFGDGGILFLAPNGTDYILNVLGGLGYGQGNHSAPAGTSAYWATSADPGANYGRQDNLFTPGDDYTLTITVENGVFTLYQGSTQLTQFTDAGLTQFRVGLYDNQPNTTTGSGSGPSTSFSDFSVSGTLATPEPATWAMLLTAFAGLGAVGYRKSRGTPARV